jgi:hypothetical protein
MASPSSSHYTFSLDWPTATTKTVYEKGKEVIIIEDTPSRSPSNPPFRSLLHSTPMSPSHTTYYQHRSKRPKYTSNADLDEPNSRSFAKHKSEFTPYMCRISRHGVHSTASSKSGVPLTDPSGFLPIVVPDDPPRRLSRKIQTRCRDDGVSTLKGRRRERSNIARRCENNDSARRYRHRSSARHGRYHHPYISREPRGHIEIGRSHRHQNYYEAGRQDDVNHNRYHGRSDQKYVEKGLSNKREHYQFAREERRRISVTDTSTRTKYAVSNITVSLAKRKKNTKFSLRR